MRLPELPWLLSIGVLPLVRRPMSHVPVGLGVLSAQTIPLGLASRRHVQSPIDALVHLKVRCWLCGQAPVWLDLAALTRLRITVIL